MTAVVLKFISDYFHLLGWATLITMVWRVSSRFTAFMSKFESVAEKASVTEKLVSTLSTNHLPHLQTELEHINRNLEENRKASNDQIAGLRHDLLVLITTIK